MTNKEGKLREIKILDLFAGTGVGVACQRLGIQEHGVEIMPAAIASRDAAGFSTPYNDAWDIDKAEELDFNAIWASPPCQPFSVAANWGDAHLENLGSLGVSKGAKEISLILDAIQSGVWKQVSKLREFGEVIGDQRSALVMTPLTYADRFMPTFIVQEQVPGVLPIWAESAEQLGAMGYSTWTGILNSVDYGVPQSRKRAYLIARRDGRIASAPRPTLPGSSMAEAIGWGLTRRPSPTLTSHLGVTRSPSGTQAIYRKAIESGDFIFKPVEPVRSRVAKNGIGSEYAPNTINIDVNEGGILQTYPDGFPFRGTSTEQQLQVGNAVPPLMAEAILRMFQGYDD